MFFLLLYFYYRTPQFPYCWLLLNNNEPNKKHLSTPSIPLVLQDGEGKDYLLRGNRTMVREIPEGLYILSRKTDFETTNSRILESDGL